MLPSVGETSADSIGARVMMSLAGAAAAANGSRAPITAAALTSAIGLNIDTFIFGNRERNLHGPATDLAILDIRLVSRGKVEQHVDFFPTEGTAYCLFD